MPLSRAAIRIWDGTKFADVDIDSLVSTDVFHHRVHEGKYWTVTDYDGNVQAAAPKYWHLKAPDTAIRCHTVMAIAVNDETLIELYEAPTLTGNGTALTAYNNDRNSATAATCLFYNDPTVTAPGTKLQNDLIGTNNPKTRIGGNVRQVTEIILKQNTSYIIKNTVTNNGTRVSFNLELYEV
jgi:hypothetical protein